MSKLGEKLHALIGRLSNHNVVVHDIEEVVTEVTGHLNETVIPVIEAKISEFLPGAIQKAISDALAAEREEAQKIATKLEETYRKLVEGHGNDAANKAMADAMTPKPEQAPAAAEGDAPAAS